MKLKLHWQILIAMLAGMGIGLIFQIAYKGEPSGWLFSVITSLGTIFIRLLRMVIVPLIFTSIVSGVSSVGEGKSIGRLGLKTILFYISTSLFAILIGLTLTNLIQPGVGAHITATNDFSPEKLAKPGSPAEILIRMIPLNPVEAASSGDMLGIIFFSIFLGIVITKTQPKTQKFLTQLFNSGFEVMMKITENVIKLVPFGVLGLITKAVATAGFGLFVSVGSYMLTIFTGLSIHLFVTLPAIFFFMTRINPAYHFKAMTPALMTAFSTSSSNATLPVTMRNVETNAGISNKISSFVLPMGATVNMDGTALYECAGVIFISQVLGLHLSIAQQFIIVITALLASIGCAGIPSAGLVIIFIVTQAVGFRDNDVAVIIGTMLAVDRPLDMYRTMVNIFSDSVGAVIIAKSEGEKNLYPEYKKQKY
jgi:proton glutamate symport protein